MKNFQLVLDCLTMLAAWFNFACFVFTPTDDTFHYFGCAVLLLLSLIVLRLTEIAFKLRKGDSHEDFH